MVDQTTETPLTAAEVEGNTVEDHIALIYETDEERLSTITPLIKVGLERGDLCLYVSHEENDAAIVEALRAENIDVEKAVNNGSLILTSKKEVYFKLGRFDPEWTIRVINNIADLAKSYGFTAMRVMSDMTWTQEKVPGVDRWPDYEARINGLNPGISLRIICQYDRRAFSPEALMAAIQTHPRIVSRGVINRNSFYIPAEDMPKENFAEVELERIMDIIRQVNSAESEIRERDRAIEVLNRQVKADSAAMKSLEASLEDSRRRFRDLAERASDWAWELDEKGVYVYSSPRVRDVLGLQPEDVIGRTPLDLVSKEEADRVSKLLTKAMSSHSPITALEKEVRHRDGHAVYLEMSATPQFDRDGKFLGYRGVDRDITGRKAVKQALEDSRKRNDEFLSEVQARDQRISALDAEIVQLRSSLAEMDADIASVREEMERKRSELAESAEGLSRLQEALQAQEAELTATRSASEERQIKVDAHVTEIARLQSELATKGLEITGINAALAAAQALSLGKDKEVDELTTSYQAQSMELKGLRESLSGVEEALAHKESEHFAIRQQVERLEADLMAKSGEIATRTEELSALREQLARTGDDLEQRGAELAGAKEEISTLQGTLASANEDLEKRAGELAAISAELTRAREEIAANSAELEQRTADLATTRDELSGVRETLASTATSLEQKLAELAAVTGTLEQRTEELSTAREDLERAREALASSDTALEQRAADLTAAQELMTIKENELAASQQDAAALRVALSAAEEELNSLTLDRDARLGEIEQARGEIARLNDDLAAKRSALGEAIASYEGAKADIAVLTEGSERDRAAIEQLEQEKERSLATIRDREAALAEARSAIDAASAELKIREGEMAAAAASMKEKDGDLAQAVSRAEMLSKVLVLKEEELSASLKDTYSSRSSSAALRSRAGQLDADLNVSATVIAGLREALGRRQGEISSALAAAEAEKKKAAAAEEERSRLSRELLRRDGALYAAGIELKARDEALALTRGRLLESEERFRAVFGQSGIGMVRVALDGSLMEANGRFHEMTGYTPEEISGRAFLDIVHADDAEASGALQRQLAAGGSPSGSMLKRLVRKSGSTMWANVTMSPVRDDDGVKYLMAVVDDRTEQILAEQSLREKEYLDREERMRNAMENSADGVWVLDPEGRTTFVNRSLADMLGYVQEDMAGRMISGLINDEWRKGNQNVGGREMRLVRKDGGDLWATISSLPILDQSGQVKGAVGLVKDITALKERELSLEEAKAAVDREAAIMRNAIDGMISPVAVVSPEGRVILANSALKKMMGSDVIGGAVGEIWPGLDISQPGVVEVTRDGQTERRGVLPSALRDGMHDIGTFLDFTGVLPPEVENKISQETLAHDLNDSLQVIMGSVSLAKEYVIPEGRMYSKLKQIESASVTARDLASQLMTSAREGHPLSTSEPSSSLVRGNGRLLLMDDDENVLEATGDLLRYLGYSVEVARDGDEARAMVKEAEEIWQSYDLAILDLSISSGVGGLEASKALTEVNPQLIMVVTSGYVSDPILLDPTGHGFAAALPKPYSAELLSSTIAKALSGRPPETKNFSP
ncbi:MAG: PAS domain S-box protein [Methanomassiliicoccus sp.]|nr:PAS domain S-box protein [Methanomassiliicoccus sp.]